MRHQGARSRAWRRMGLAPASAQALAPARASAQALAPALARAVMLALAVVLALSPLATPLLAAPATASLEPDAPRAEPSSVATGPAPTVPPVPGQVVGPFDPPAHPYGPGRRGVRLAATPGEPVRAARAGTVSFAGEVAGVGWVSVDHGGGLVTSHGPLVPRATAGQEVARGEVVGRVDDATTLHWGARIDGEYVDPLHLLTRWRPTLRAS